jgi:amidase
MTVGACSTLDATAQAALLRRGELSSRELVAATIARIEALNPRLNAVIHPRFERALEECRVLPPGPLAGVPFLVKDLMCTTAGDPYHAGSGYLRKRGNLASADSHLAARYRAAGLVFVGRTNTPEFGLVTTTEPLAFGATRNPWSAEYSPGGSSGGSAAAVAAGLVAVAHGNDGGGSIRIPAAHCGLVGLKPSRGRISLGPARGDLWLGAACEHVLSRSVRDSALLLDVTHGYCAGDPCTAPPPPLTWVECLAQPVRRLRIGLMTVTPGARTPLHPACGAAARRVAETLAGAGHRVEEAWPSALARQDEERAFFKVLSAWVAHDIDAMIASGGQAPAADEIEPSTRLVADWGRALAARDYVAAQIWLQGWAREVAAWWDQGFDLLLTPTTAQPPPRLGVALPTPDNPLAPLRASLPYMAFTAPFNITGQPAISLPAGHDAAGLPLGVQLVAGYGREDLLLQVATELEQAQPWHTARPPLYS